MMHDLYNNTYYAMALVSSLEWPMGAMHSKRVEKSHLLFVESFPNIICLGEQRLAVTVSCTSLILDYYKEGGAMCNSTFASVMRVGCKATFKIN